MDNVINRFNDFLAGRAGSLSAADADRILSRYEWFTTARRLREVSSGVTDRRLILSKSVSPTVPPVFTGVVQAEEQRMNEPDAVPVREDENGAEMEGGVALHGAETETGTGTVLPPEGDLVDKFLECGAYRIVAPEDGGETEIELSEGFEAGDEDGLATEELAEIYCRQGLYAEAIEIYHRLSLLNTEKSVYFANVISEIKEKISDN